MSDTPNDLQYTQTHEWVRYEDDGSCTVGITDHAQQALGDIVYVEQGEVGANLEANEACCVVESVKAASDIYSPIAGELIATNGLLAETPELVNSDPYGEGWIFRVQPTRPADLEDLLDADSYLDFLASET